MTSNVFTGEPSYDLFLSYNSTDHSFVENIARRLRDAGLEPFLDRWHLAPGMRWRSRLEETLSSCKAVAIFVGPGEMGSWQQREVDVALDLQSRSPSLPIIPVLLPGCEPPLGFLRQLTWVDLRSQVLDQGIEILIKAAHGEAPGPDLQKHFDSVRASICPYRGLLHFREEDAPFFFGREATLDKLVSAIQRQTFVAVVGASGSGKSSVVRAGLVPRLRSERHTVWETVILVPTDQPLKALARGFLPLLEPTIGEVDGLAEAGKLAEHFRSGTISLYDIVERILEKQSGRDRLVIVVDQFEELYTLTSDQETRRRFLDELLAASSRTGSKANVALTLRGDFVGKAFAYRPLSDRLQDAQINLGPMTREELECAIRKPAEKIQLEFEPGLVPRILDDVRDEPGNLPLLEFVLKELWAKRRGRVLLNETYDAIGGLQGAVATKADELFKGLSSAKQKILQRVFLRIVRPAESGLDTRRRAAFSELPPEGEELVLKLTNERLLVTNQSASGLEQTVEVAHEALISSWGTLRGWVNEDREFLLWRERLNALRIEWERVRKNEDALLRGALLIEAQRWFDQRSQDLSDQERKFIFASREERERLAREEKERQEREIQAAQRLALAEATRAKQAEKHAKEQKESANKLRRRAIVAAGAAVAALVLLMIAAVMWRQSESERIAAREQAQIATNQRLAAQSSAKMANDARDQADGLINFMLFDLRDKLISIGRLQILDGAVKKAQDYLQRLPKDIITNARLRQQAVAFWNIGDVFSAQGKLQEALKDYEQSLKIFTKLGDQEPANADWQHLRSVGYEKVGDVFRTQGNLEEALKDYEVSLEIFKKLVRQDPSNAGWQHDLSIGYEKVGEVLGSQCKLEEALKAYQQSLEIFRELAHLDPANAGMQHDLSVGYEKVGEVLGSQGKLEEALKAHQQSLEIRKKVADQDPSNAAWQHDLSIGYERVGIVFSSQGKLEEALKAHHQSLEIFNRLAEQDPGNAGWQRDLSVSYNNVGDVFRTQGNLEEALKDYERSLEIFKKLVPQDPSNAGWQHDLSIGYERVGIVLSSQGKLEEALKAADQSLEIRRELADRDPSNAAWQHDLSASYNNIGDVLSTQGKLQEAFMDYQQSLEIFKKLADRDHSNAAWQHDLSVGYEKVGQILGSQGKLEEALKAYQQSLEIFKRLADQDPSNAGWQSDLSVSYEKVGDFLRMQGKLNEARAAYLKMLPIARNLAEQDSGNLTWQHVFSVSWERIGYSCQDISDITGAAAAYEHELEILRKVSAVRPEDVSLQVDYAESELDLGGVYRLLGRKEEARQLLEQARDTLVDLQKRAPLSPSQQRISDRIEKELSILQ